MWMLKDKYDGCCENSGCEAFDNCTECWDEWAERNPPMTNADRIRAMSDEELMEFICQQKYIVMCKEGCLECTYHGDCEKRFLEWLKQPAEE